MMKFFSLFLIIVSLLFVNCAIHTQPIVFTPIIHYADVEGDVIISGFRLLYGGTVYISYPNVTKSTDVGDETVSNNRAYYYYSFKNLELDYDTQDITLRFYAFDEYDNEILYKTISVTIDEGKNNVDISL